MQVCFQVDLSRVRGNYEVIKRKIRISHEHNVFLQKKKIILSETKKSMRRTHWPQKKKFINLMIVVQKLI